MLLIGTQAGTYIIGGYNWPPHFADRLVGCLLHNGCSNLHLELIDIEYTWINCQRKISHQFRLLICTSFIAQFVYSIGGEGIR